jgi:hypothetical protein
VCEHVFVKLAERREAERLRGQTAMSIKAIAVRLAVSPSSVSRWVRDIELLPQQQEALVAASRTGPGRLRGAAARREGARTLQRARAAGHRGVVAGAPRAAGHVSASGHGQPPLVGVTAPAGQCPAVRTARVCLYSTFVVQSIYGAIQEYAGIDRPEWLG